MTSPVIAEWMENAQLMNRGAVGQLALVLRKGLSRGDVVANADVISPILKHCGTSPSLDDLARLVERFFALARPRGKPSIPSPLV